MYKKIALIMAVVMMVSMLPMNVQGYEYKTVTLLDDRYEECTIEYPTNQNMGCAHSYVEISLGSAPEYSYTHKINEHVVCTVVHYVSRFGQICSKCGHVANTFTGNPRFSVHSAC